MGVGGWGWTSLESAWLGLDVGGVTYLLQATFDADNQGYADAQVLDTDAEGVQDGQLTVVEVDGTLAIVSNECAFTAQSTPSWGDLGFYSQAITRTLGYTLVGTINLTTWEEMGIGWHTAGAVVDPDSGEHAVQAHATNGQLDHGGGSAIATGLSTSTDYQLALVLGGYDSNGVPWHDGASGTFTYGASVFIEISGTWTLLWRDEAGNTATLYALLSVLDGVGTLDDFRVPDADLSAVLEPLVKDTFTDGNGTSLDAHDPEVGSAGTEHSSDWEIQDNRARNKNNVSGNHTWETDEADLFVSGIVNCGGRETSTGLLALRYSDEDNLWFAGIKPSTNTIKLYERTGASTTERASGSVTIDASTDYVVVVIADDEDVTAFVDGGARIAYGSAASNKTETRHGLRTAALEHRFDNFHVHRRTGSQYDDVFDLY